ncbi:hypothetical protein D3C80_1383360 [compost metagenome]
MAINLQHPGAQPCDFKGALQHIQQPAMAGRNSHLHAHSIAGRRLQHPVIQSGVFKVKGDELLGGIAHLCSDFGIAQACRQRHQFADGPRGRQCHSGLPTAATTALQRALQGLADHFGVGNPAVQHGPCRQRLKRPGPHVPGAFASVQLHQSDRRRGNFYPQE